MWHGAGNEHGGERNDAALAAAACREDEITRVLRTLKEQLEKHRAKKLTVRLDDQDLSDGSPVHIDDKPWSTDKDKLTRSSTIDIKVGPHASYFSALRGHGGDRSVGRSLRRRHKRLRGH